MAVDEDSKKDFILIEESDAVIFSVPCFQGHLPGILKNFTDHMAFMLHRPRYFTKKALIN